LVCADAENVRTGSLTIFLSALQVTRVPSRDRHPIWNVTGRAAQPGRCWKGITLAAEGAADPLPAWPPHSFVNQNVKVIGAE